MYKIDIGICQLVYMCWFCKGSK